MDKAARIGIRMADLLDKETFAEKLKIVLDQKNRMFTKMYDAEPVAFDDIFEEYYAYGQEFAKYVCDTSVVVNDSLDHGEKVLFEGAQGVLLDLDHGTYPFVTSSNASAGGSHQVSVSVQLGSITSSVSVKRTRHVSVTVRSQRNCSMTSVTKSVKSVVNTGRRQDVRVVLVGSTLSSFATRAVQVG